MQVKHIRADKFLFPHDRQSAIGLEKRLCQVFRLRHINVDD